jgi:hypothetical protein
MAEELREMSGAGENLSGIARHLNAVGIPTAMGGRWQAVQVKRVLESPRLRSLNALPCN